MVYLSGFELCSRWLPPPPPGVGAIGSGERRLTIRRVRRKTLTFSSLRVLGRFIELF